MKNCLLLPLIATSVLFSSCAVNSVNLSVVEPAPVTIVPEIKTAGIVARTAEPRDKKLKILDEILTAEDPTLDKDGAQAAAEGLGYELQSNGRLQFKPIKIPTLASSTVNVMPPPLNWDTVAKICRENEVDILFSLEYYDTDSKVSYASAPVDVHTPLGRIPVPQTIATVATLIKMSWRIYDPVSKYIIDEYSVNNSISSSGSGITPIAAVKAVAGRKENVKAASNAMAQDYGKRIIPMKLNAYREYYVRGNEHFETARNIARTGDWNKAAEIWKKETTNTNTKIAARAYFNMGVVSEINGKLDHAIEWETQAYQKYGDKRALRYLNTLKKRKERLNTLSIQQGNKDTEGGGK